MPVLKDQMLTDMLNQLDDWKVVEEKLYKKCSFSSFTDAFFFMKKVAGIAEEMNHHPYWVNEYGTVEIYLETHSEGGITMKDIEMAKKIDEISE